MSKLTLLFNWIKFQFSLESVRQNEINRLRKVLQSIVDSRPDQYMDIDKNPELVNWICDTCSKANVGRYPQN